MGIRERKDDHLRICLTENVQSRFAMASGFSRYRFDHDALPELEKSKIDIKVQLLGRELASPIVVGSMTGGTDRAAEINRRLALAARQCQIGFALGSMRPMLENPDLAPTFQVRDHAPDLPLLFGNIGAVQLNYGVGIPEIQHLINEVQCDAFFLHLNPLQECIQRDGNTNFSDLLRKIDRVCQEIKIPIFLKEVGNGFSETTMRKIQRLGLAGVEVAGHGGTSWSKIESLRADHVVQQTTGELFADWGISTAESILNARRALPTQVVFGSGGIRNGIEIAKAIALGADAVCVAWPLLKAAEESVESVVLAIEQLNEQLRTTMFLTGSRNISELKTRVLRERIDFSGL